ncbi:MAG: TrbI/VirB10 family protein, partial [Alphaproteobacteria bacterium]|nr:TrbI/VirB10 family protein [Alphaproteobacteria bacterium]
MSKFKELFSDWRKNTPKRVQWLLLALAFMVVLIMFTLLLTDGNKKAIDVLDSEALALDIKPTTIEWPDVTVGESKTQTIEISATGPVKILNIGLDKEVKGLTHETNCTNVGEVNTEFSCTITVDYAPTEAMTASVAQLIIEWRGADLPDKMKHTSTYILLLGAQNPQVEQPEPQVIEKIVEKIIEVPVSQIKPADEEEKKELDLIATPKPFETVSEYRKSEYTTPSESCSDFAFPGYGTSGQQIGWIKPKGGAYYFYPFSDKKCENATGVYNPDSGIITDINNKSKKIGTDADHIGYAAVVGGTIPQLSAPYTGPQSGSNTESTTITGKNTNKGMGRLGTDGFEEFIGFSTPENTDITYLSSGDSDTVVSSKIHDRQFLLRQYKPIPATIVSDIRADAEALANGVPVRATVDRNVYSDSGRNVIIPTGTMMLGYVSGGLPGPYTSVGRMQINWYQFILPNGVEFNFTDETPFSADSQGKVGVPGYGSTDYLEQFFMPMLTAIVPAAVNLIAPVTDAFVNQIDLDNNTVVQSGTVRSSELAKNEIITAWNQVAQKLLVDMMDNTVPPFTIAAGTRINVYSPVDLMVTCGDPNGPNKGKKCAIAQYGSLKRNDNWKHSTNPKEDGSWVGQVRSFAVAEYCTTDKNGNKTVDPKCKDTTKCGGYDYATLLFYCQSQNYQAINMAKQEQVFQNQQDASNKNSIAYISNQGQ